MASGRPRQPNDPGIMASVEAAMSTVARPRLITRIWPWCYEFSLIAGTVLGMIGIGVTLGPGWLIAAAAAAMAILGVALTWRPSCRRIIDLDRGEAGSPEPAEPALYYGLGLPRPLG